jgi:hypothetical protein
MVTEGNRRPPVLIQKTTARKPDTIWKPEVRGMMVADMTYFGERENGPPIRDQETLTLPAWQGIVGLIQSGLRLPLFAEDFPDRACTDEGKSGAITGCNERQFYLRLKGDHPEIVVPLDADNVPGTTQALEVVEFCHRHASKPLYPDPHPYRSHHHYLQFSREAGQAEFASEINTILTRNHLAYELQSNGEVRRLLPPVLREALASAIFVSGDDLLNQLLETARQKFGSPDFRTRYDALKDLWDGFERLKTLEPPGIKPQSADALIARVSQEPKVREMLAKEMRAELNDFGNGFLIRHADASQVSLRSSEEIDYLFHRLFAVIRLLLRSTGRGQ